MVNENKESWYKKGLKLADEGKYQDALRCYEEALLLDPKDIIIWGRRGVLLYHLGRYESAIGSFNRALNGNPKDYVLWRGKGFSLEKIGRKEDAKECFSKVKELQIEEIAKKHSTKPSNIHTCARCGNLYVSESKSNPLCPECYHTVKDGDQLSNPISKTYYSLGKVIDTDHYE